MRLPSRAMPHFGLPHFRLRRGLFALAMTIGGVALAPACGPTHSGPDIATRMTQAKSMAEGFGFTAYGAAATGTVEEGKDTKVALTLKEGCYQIFAFAGDGLKGIDLSLVDPSGKATGEGGAKQEGQSSVKQCVSDPGAYTLVVKSQGGSGSFIAQPYASSQKGSDDGNGSSDPNCPGPDCADDPNNGNGDDDCNNPPELSVGASVHGNTSRKGMGPKLSCTANDSAQVAAYKVHIDGRHKLVVDLSAKFDAAVGIFRATTEGYICDPSSELECSDDSEGSTNKSHAEAVVDSGDYGVVITGFDTDRGDYDLKSRLDDAPSLDVICNAARPIAAGSKQSDIIDGSGSNFRATCADPSSNGDEVIYKVDVKQRSRMRLTGKGNGDLTLSVRSRCEDPSSEVACTNRYKIDGVSWTGMMAPGSYTVITDSANGGSGAAVDTQVDLSPELGSGAAEGESCTDAKALTLPGGAINADTFPAKADVKVSCASDATADVVYKLDLKAKSRVFVSSNGEEEGRHVVAIQKTCGDTKGEVSCDMLSSGKTIDPTLDPGVYYVVVKAKANEDFGRVKLNVRARDLAEAGKACKTATKLVSGTSASDTTVGQPDRFLSPTCGGTPIGQQMSGDKVYQFTLTKHEHVHLELKSNSFYNAIMSLRSDCVDPTRGELTCSSNYSKVIDRDMDAGTYYVVVDGYGPGSKAEGAYTIELTTK